jgi:hypothetical protein
VPDGAGGLSAPSASKKPAQRLRWWIHRLTLLVATGLLCWIAFEWVGGLVLQHHFARKYSLTVDHRLVPYSRPDINGDGIRCHFEADDFDSASTNIVFLGDSFTYGAHLDGESQAFPAGVARILDPDGQRIRSINFGWPSSSPLLSMRLLADIGHKYKPDMVVMSLDLTDFYDEHKYIRMIRFPRLSPTAFLLREAGLSWLIADWVGWSELRGDHHELPFPNTFYIVRQPLAESRPYLHEIETNLRRIEDHTRGVLEAKFVLVLLPRAFQYTDAEAPHDPHRNLYPPLGPYVLEPNRWFDEFCAETGFTCFSLLDDFRNSPVFPTCFENDPHWNVAGHQVAAEALAEDLRDLF